MIALALALVGGVFGGPVASAAESPSAPPAVREIQGACGTLMAAGTSAVSLFKEVAARGAGWVSLVISLGCLTQDGMDYSDAYNLTPEGRASIQLMRDRYSGWSVSDWMTAAGCTVRERRPAIADSVDPARSHWDCSSSPHRYAD
ncbi:hypothetical protein [Pseudonocardia sp. ICBG1293]|uniref:hypothetical protein n=1 Tax=Pseudonocardia sp. ICBG1293 TaxID=2844382 RepID=UPI001CCEB9F7|nr:hypothetical protein [Pseudonocardia sp. ICBG1293]